MVRRLINFVLGKRRVLVHDVVPKTEGWWTRLTTKHLLLFNTLSSGGLMFVGDIAAQKLEMYLGEKNKDKGFDWHRLLRMTIVGTLYGPLHHYYYGWVDRILPKSDGKSVFNKIMLDQFVASPLFIVSYFYSAGILEGGSIKDCNNELKFKFFTIYKADWIVWPPCQFINFYYLPLQYRVLYINFITTLYNVFLCYIKHADMSESKFFSHLAHGHGSSAKSVTEVEPKKES